MAGASTNALKNDIIKALNVREFYENRLQVRLKISADGWSEHVHCPFHGDTGKPNLSINIHTGGFHCFACGKAGSIFDFVSLSKGQDPKTGFQKALIELATKAGIDIDFWKTGNRLVNPPPKPVDVKQTPEPKPFVPSLQKADAKDSSEPPLPKSLIKTYQKNLGPTHYKYLLFKRGLTEATLQRYEIGWDGKRKYKDNDNIWKNGRFAIPILNKTDELRNIRAYAPDALNKMVNTKPHGSPPRLFPLHELVKRKPKHIIYCEGEFDCILLNQKLEEAGLKTWLACTNTAGCNTFEPEWLEFFLGSKFYFLFDVDPPGKRWATMHCTQYFLPGLSTGNFEEVKIVYLPLDGTKEFKDITDYFVKSNGQLSDLMQLIDRTQVIQAGGTNNEEATISPIEVQDFVHCMMDRRYIDMHIQVPLTISGESTKLYHATRAFRVVQCPEFTNGCCSEGSTIATIPYGDTLFIESCMASKKQLTISLQNIACTRGKCPLVEEVEKVVMQEYFGHQVVRRLIAEEDEQGRLVNRQELLTAPLYVIQPERHLDVGPQDYIATGYVRSHPGTRSACLLVEHLEPMEADWSQFKVNETTIQPLKKIQAYPNVKALMNEITQGVTQIYEADDILLTVLLTYLSPLRMIFNGQPMPGWINSCIIGDSGTGKSKTYQRISNWIQLGDLFSALSGSRTGLLYAMKQKGVEWYVQIGRYVMASGKIIAIDETQEIEAEDIKKMAIAMKEGWLEVSQVASGGYRTQTRTLFLMNPKFGKKISDFAYGCQSIIECFDPMFIRRLDLTIFTSGNEDHSFYNKQFDVQAAASIVLKPEDLRSLIYWAWTRSMQDIKWSDESTKYCLQKAVELSGIYGHADDIPLVCPQDFRENLARLSASFAILSGSFTEDYEGIIITPKHIEIMSKFVDACYSSSACNLRQHSKNSARKKQLHDYEAISETFQKVIEKAKASSDRRFSEGFHFIQLLLVLQQQHYVKKRDLCEQLSVGMPWVQRHIAILQMHHLVEVFKGGYKSTRKFNQFIRRWQEEDKINSDLMDSIHEKLGKLALYTDPEPDFGNGTATEYHDPFSSTRDYYEP